MFSKVLVANRGEIACRVIGTLKRLGIQSIAVFSDADAGARHVAIADIAVHLGAASPRESYLNIQKIVDAAVALGAEAIHPGYGFLSESAAFAAACEDASIVFVGPPVEAIHVMGDKIRAKAKVSERNVPVVPGSTASNLSDKELTAAALAIGFPILIKPSAGGGGKGMHVAASKGELASALSSARREASSSFGDDTLLIERFVATPRHIEVQVLADNAGNTVHLWERECSLQRRHQKVIEEAPSVLLDAATRARIGQAAIDTAESVHYRGVGTVEFIVSSDSPDEFYFMEMNTRLQVEHPVTEMITGLDLVEWQLRVASGQNLNFTQEDVAMSGHSIEARIYAEDPQQGFLPSGGRVLKLVEPSGEGVRVDSALLEGLDVTSDYDPMLAKVVAWGPDRESALRRLQAALSDTATLGVTNNVEFLKLLLSNESVMDGRLDTELIEREFASLPFRELSDAILVTAALIMHAVAFRARGERSWEVASGWRLGAAAPSVFRFASTKKDSTNSISVFGDPIHATVAVDGGPRIHASVTIQDSSARVVLDSIATTSHFALSENRVYLVNRGAAWTLEDIRFERPVATLSGLTLELKSPMPGVVVAVMAQDGEIVDAEAPVLSIEAMKMEHVLRASQRGTVSLLVDIGSQVKAGELVATIKPLDVGSEGDSAR